MRETSRFSKIGARLVLVLVSLSFALVALEVGVRIFLPQNEYALVLAPWGFTHKPNARIRYRRHGHAVPIRYNGKGLRGKEYSYQKPRGVFRILILGDSFAEDMASFYENLFSTRMEKRLNETYKNPRFEVINAGHFAFDNTQELLYYLREGRKYQPDLVVVLYAVDHASTRFATVENGVLKLHYQEFTPWQHTVRAAVTWVRMNSHLGSLMLDKFRDIEVSGALAAWLRVRLTRVGAKGPKAPQVAKAPQPASQATPAPEPAPETSLLGEKPLAVFPPDHPNVADLPEKTKKELRAKGVIRPVRKPGRMSNLDWLVWKRFGSEVAKDGAKLVVFQIWKDSLGASAEEQKALKLTAYNLDVSSIWGNRPYKKALAEGTYDPRLDSHRWGYDGNRRVAEKILGVLQREGHLPPLGR